MNFETNPYVFYNLYTLDQMFYLHKNPSGEIELNFDSMTSKMMQDKVLRSFDTTS